MSEISLKQQLRNDGVVVIIMGAVLILASIVLCVAMFFLAIVGPSFIPSDAHAYDGFHLTAEPIEEYQGVTEEEAYQWQIKQNAERDALIYNLNRQAEYDRQLQEQMRRDSERWRNSSPSNFGSGRPVKVRPE